MERRRFLTLTAGGFLAASFAPEGTQADKVHHIGILGNVPISDSGGARLWGAFADGLRALGYVDGRNIRIEHLSSEGRYERLPALAADPGRPQVDAIVAAAGAT